MNAFSCFYCANKQETYISFRVQRYDDILKVVAQAHYVFVTIMLQGSIVCYRKVTIRDGDKKIRLEPHEFQPDLFII